MNTNKRFWCLDEYKGETSPIVDGKFAPTNEWLCNKLNELNDENDVLKQQLKTKYIVNKQYEELQKVKEENEQLKQDIGELQNDKLLTELQIKCDKKQEHIVLLENKIHRMREDIKRLEALYHYRGYIGSGDVKKEYYRMEKLLRAENEQLKQSLDYEQRMHEWFKNEAYLLQNKLDNREDEIINLKKENEQLKKGIRELEKEVNYLSCGEADWLIEEEL